MLIGEVFNVIWNDDVDIMFVGGVEVVIINLLLVSFGNVYVLLVRNEDFVVVSWLFDVDCDGFVMSEGVGIVVLELLDNVIS